MRALRPLLAGLLLIASLPAQAAEDQADWALFGRIVALVQPLLRLAVTSDDPRAVEKGIDAVLAGNNPDANRIAGELGDEMFAGMPADMKANLATLGRDLAALAQKERARAPLGSDAMSVERAMQARRDLSAIGLRYYDSAQFLDAVRRDDALAVELFVLGRGVNLEARDEQGLTAVEIARRNGNAQIAALVGAGDGAMR